MFDGIAPRYDLLNHLLSFGRDIAWRRHAAERVVSEAPAGPIADIACGTGDMLLMLARAGGANRSHGMLVGLDVSRGMLGLAARRVTKTGGKGIGLVTGDAGHVPLGPEQFAAVTVAFGIRNLPDLTEGIRAMSELLMPGGVLGILEFTSDHARWMASLFGPYARFVIPTLGRLISRDPTAYKYLPKSVATYATSDEMWKEIQTAGLVPVLERSFSGGICRLFLARRRRGAGAAGGEST
jgi:demethylmenaquinone methyltransferase/2-methoxy-6-polyprenyl-1,4-benzoquinol methylase